jgi:glutamate formiminotransferase/formiminotetrahydrofolate cyclodeaminase
VAARCGALGGALAAMVANLTIGKKGLEASWDPMREAAAKERAVQQATKGAAEVPLSVLERSLEVLALAEATVHQGNPNSASDAGVAALCARTCAEGAYLNVRINLKSLIDTAWVAQTKKKAEELRKRAVERAEAIPVEVEETIG